MLFFVTVALVAALSPAFAAGEPPVAEAGLGLIAYVGDTVILDGSASFDPEGDPLVYTWAPVGGPPTELQSGDTAQPRFLVKEPGTLRFSLVVSDGTSASGADAVEVVVPHQQIDGVEASCASAVGAPWLGLVAAGLALARRARTRRSAR
ncbi:MAG: hypothetical protein Q8P18_24250 [Pseudomonadota bacterium]|nr:hypothetical protein [Pseudomonadota bacterium]